ncbi:hypothetical protein L917_18885, partial [Phytophthora nicotianae]
MMCTKEIADFFTCHYSIRSREISLTSVLMRHTVVQGLVFVAFVAASGAVFVVAESLETTPDAWALPHSFSTITGRNLRAPTHPNEERAVGTSAVSADHLQAWLKRGDTTNSVFKALQLQKVGDALLDSAQLTALIKYLKLFNEANPTKKTTLVATLTAHYGNQGLAKIIEAGQQ